MLLRTSILLAACALASAQFRGGSISWEPVSMSPGANVVRFTVRRYACMFAPPYLRCGTRVGDGAPGPSSCPDSLTAHLKTDAELPCQLVGEIGGHILEGGQRAGAEYSRLPAGQRRHGAGRPTAACLTTPAATRRLQELADSE